MSKISRRWRLNKYIPEDMDKISGNRYNQTWLNYLRGTSITANIEDWNAELREKEIVFKTKKDLMWFLLRWS